MSAACEIIIPAFGFCRTTRAEGDRVPQELLFEIVQRDHYSYTRLNRAAINELRTAPSASGDEEAAHALIDLLIDDLPQDPEHDGLMDNSETGAVIRCLKAVLRRLGTEFEVPFHDKQGYYSFRMEHSNGLSTDLTKVFTPARAALERRERNTFTGGLRGLRNLIFAAARKPEIVWRDVAGGVIEITKNKDHCLLYDRPVGASGLTWSELGKWWRLQDGMYGMSERLRLQALLKRLRGVTQRPGAAVAGHLLGLRDAARLRRLSCSVATGVSPLRPLGATSAESTSGRQGADAAADGLPDARFGRSPIRARAGWEGALLA
jgi:hypothetical protein